MSQKWTSCDVLVVGAGSAGATTALKCGQHDLEVCLVDSRPRERAGASWLNGVETRLFRDLDLPVAEPVMYHAAAQFHIESPGGFRVSTQAVPTLEISMGHLNDHLLDLAESSGATMRFGQTLDSLIVENGVIRGARFRCEDGMRVVQAKVTVDASGLEGAVRSRLSKSLWNEAAVEESDLCVAAQQTREVGDKDAARRFLSANRLGVGDVLSWAGLAGGYSILNVSVEPEKGRATFLTGAMRSKGPQTHLKLIEEGLRRLPFAGRKLSGGAGLIPVRRAFDRLVGPGFALIGNAACQVFPAHGSGVAAGMRAAQILSGVIRASLKSGRADPAALWPYAVAYQRGRGALCASQELVRRFTETLSQTELDAMVRSGALNATALTQILDCQPLRLSLSQLWGAAKAISRAPRMSQRLLATAARALLVQRHYRAFPKTFDPATFARWQKRSRRLLK